MPLVGHGAIFREIVVVVEISLLSNHVLEELSYILARSFPHPIEVEHRLVYFTGDHFRSTGQF